jgi:SAM-dependent methyltransferase
MDGSSERDPYETIAGFYDLATAGFDEDLALYEALAKRQGGPVLELGVGTGRVALALAARGYAVTGIDRSAAMLTLAQEKSRAAGRSLDLRLDDIRRPNVAGSFRLILCALDTFLHLEDTAAQLSTLASIRRLLSRRGVIVLDLPGPGGDWGDWQPGARPLVLDWSLERDGDRISRLSSFQADLSTQTRTVLDVFEEIAADGAVRRHVAEYRLRFVFPAEMELLLHRGGLRLSGRYGGYDLRPFDADSPRMVVLAERDHKSDRVDLAG